MDEGASGRNNTEASVNDEEEGEQAQSLQPSVGTSNGTTNDVNEENARSSNGSNGERRRRRRTYLFEPRRSDSDSEIEDDVQLDEDEELECNANNADDSDEEEKAILSKEVPKHNWFVIKAVGNRQFGARNNLAVDEIFKRRCYGSLHCVQRLELMYKLDYHKGCVNSLNFSSDGNLLASGSDDLRVVIWDWKLGKTLLSFDTKHRANVFQSKFLPLSGGDLHVVTCSRDGQVRLAQISKQDGFRSSRKLATHRGPCHKLSIPGDQANSVLSAGEDAVVYNHDLRASKSEKILKVQEGTQMEVALFSIANHPLKPYEFCVAGRSSVVRTYDQRFCSISSSQEPLNSYHPFSNKRRRGEANKLKIENYHVTCAVYNHDGSEILASYNDEDIYLFDVKQSKPGYFVHKYQGHRNGATIKGVNFFGLNSEFVISGSDCGNVFFWDKNTEGIVNYLLADQHGVVNCLEPHPNFPFLCTSGLDRDVKVWVPSCENDPTLGSELASTVKNNLKSRCLDAHLTDNDDREMFRMLWRQLGGNENFRRAFNFTLNESAYSLSSSSSSNSDNSSSNTHSEDDDDEEEVPLGCTTQ